MSVVLRLGLTGGIGSGKSTVAQRLIEHGAELIDADQIARDVVAPGTEGLRALVDAFGPDILDADGALDRPAMARRVFGDDEARQRLNSIVHPRIGQRTAEQFERAQPDAVVVHDIPLLVENGLAPGYHLVLVVDAPDEARIRRLVQRGLSEEDARSRITAQASVEQRREVADVWLDNAGDVAELREQVDRAWNGRIAPYAQNLRLTRKDPARRVGPPRIVAPDPSWGRQARRLVERIRAVAGERGLRVDHVGSTSVPELPARDIIDLQVTVGSMEDADALAEPLTEAGFPRNETITVDRAKPIAPDPAQWAKRFHSSSDPGRPVNLHLRSSDTAGWRYALLFADWLRSDTASRAEYADLKRELALRHAEDNGTEGYSKGKEPWFDQALPRAEKWAGETGWTPPTVG